jgi:hypothetical protein
MFDASQACAALVQTHALLVQHVLQTLLLGAEP